MDAIDKLLARNPRAVMGGNKPPTLGQELVFETKWHAARAHEMVICADERCEIIDEESSQKAVLLIAQMKDLIAKIEKARVERGEPFLRDWRAVNSHYNAILMPLAGPDHKKKLEGAAGNLLARIDVFRRQRDAALEAERRRIEAEAAKEREAAERAAAVLQQGGISQKEFDEADLARRRAEDAHAKLGAQAAAAVARPIDSGFGPKTSSRKTYTVTIDNLDAAIKHCIALDAPGLTAYVIGVYQRQVRAGVLSLPGARIDENTITAIRRK